MWSREWNIKMRSWIKVYNIVEKSLFGDINMEVDIWKKWISLWCAKKYISFVRWKSPMVVGRVWARPLESCGLRAPLFHQAASSSSGVMVGHRPLWTKRRGLGENLEETGCPRKNTFLTRKLVRRAGLGSNTELCFQLLAAQNIIVSLVL